MAREIVTWCDPCFDLDARVPGREYTLGLGGQQRVIALCDAHYDEVLKPVATMLERLGQPVEGSTTKDRPRTLLEFAVSGTRKGRTPEGERVAQCLWCPLTFAADGSGITSHLRHVHDLPGSLVETFGEECPICGNAFQMVGAHIKKGHAGFGFKSVTQAFLWARDNGDPHGVYAKVLAKAPVMNP